MRDPLRGFWQPKMKLAPLQPDFPSNLDLKLEMFDSNFIRLIYVIVPEICNSHVGSRYGIFYLPNIYSCFLG